MMLGRFALVVALLGTGCARVRGAGAEFPGSIPARPEGAPYPNWEHMCITPSWGGISDLMDEAGRQGWELVAITSEGTYCFKRPSAPPGGSFPPLGPPPPPPPPAPPAPPPPPSGPGPALGGNPYAEVPPAPPVPPPPPQEDPFAQGPDASTSPAPPPPPGSREENPFAQ